MKKETKYPKLFRNKEAGTLFIALSPHSAFNLNGGGNIYHATDARGYDYDEFSEPASGVFNAQGEFVDLQNYVYPKYFKCTKEPYTLEIVKATRPETAQLFPVGNNAHFFTALPITDANGNLVTNNSPRTCLKFDWEPITGNLTVVYDE